MRYLRIQSMKRVAQLLVGLFCLCSVGISSSALAFRVTAAVDAYDPGFTNNSQNIDRQWALPRMGVPDAWSFTTGSSNIVVALVDTGVDQTHEDLRRVSFVPGYDFLQNQEILPGTDSDDNGHGTLVAGVLAATPNNGIGITGVVWAVSVMPLKALNAQGEGGSEHVAKAIRYATDHGASIINLSLGGVGFGQDVGLANAIRYAYGHNVVVIAAAGNDLAANGVDLDTDPVFPICDDNAKNMVIGVAAIDAYDQKPSFSNFGRSCVDVSAPGKRILSTIGRSPVTRAKSPNTYAYASGTSLAVPFVSGQAALLKALYPDATNRQIRDRIMATTDPVDGANTYQCAGSPCAGKLGTGRINILRSLQSKISKEIIQEGDVIQLQETGELFVLVGGRREKLSSVVLQQRYGDIAPRVVQVSDVQSFPVGQFAPPEDGTLIKVANSPTVYWMVGGIKHPITAQIFKLRGLRYEQVFTVGGEEAASWLTGRLLPPPDGVIVKSAGGKTIYWVVGGVLHPLNARFFNERGLSIFPVVQVSETDVKQFPKGESYIR